MSFKSAASFSNISAIQYQLIKNRRILGLILSAVPAQLKPHVKDCVVNDNRLLIYVSSPAWASQLRFLQNQIKTAVNQQSQEKITQLRIRMLAPAPYQLNKQSKKRIPSTENTEMLHNNAATMEEGKLKDALLSLSETLQKKRLNGTNDM
ncbi:MAG: DUF721 domain-containing protein [Methyloprofundus sp.]|nr:DUF721 domain-containing protein [Methyloprofundus sp.]